jgi:hypothetical protein
MADPGGPTGQGVDADLAGDAPLGHLLLRIEHDCLFPDGLEFHENSFETVSRQAVKEFAATLMGSVTADDCKDHVSVTYAKTHLHEDGAE